MAEGYINLHRKALDSRVFSDAELWKHWCWILLRANYTDGWFQGVLIPRGSFATGTRSAAEFLGASSSTVHRQWLRFSEWEMIELKPGRDFTVIKVCNYETYNNPEAKSGTQVGRKWDADGTPVGHRWDADGTPVGRIEKEQKEEKEQKGKATPPEPIPGSPKLAAAIASWLAYKAERREVYKPTGLKALYGRATNVAAQYGDDFVIDQMERAKASGWAGWDHQAKPTRSDLFDDPRGNIAALNQFLDTPTDYRS